ncbi:PREDICTED: protein FANTASTIC FOUR 4-like [Brassica oleracea var. oleracea]|uniref:FAF domain-containing protein n=1 Tax=Brassica oleracea var. oleracea TaxID=109376 RepID=A0A0D3B9X3_BRAOL|nr:PREDICTED: protein FANTASTIC FOUR 4-like [Brassica oleracea var. oleracea]
MATVVYQGFQSHFESQHFEPRALRLRLSSPNNPHSSTPLKSHFLDSSITPQDNISTTKATSKTESWSFLESISNSSSDDKDKKTLLPPYVHTPSSRRTFSDESLALCTESLGSETGSDVINDQDLFSVTSELQTTETRTTTTRTSRQDRKRNMMASLPPPLTSMRGLDSIQVKSHRENGRLVMTAMKPLPRNRCLQDRSYGCVRLAILIDSNGHIETETREGEEETVEILRDSEEEIPQYEEEEEVEVKVIKNTQRSNRCHEGDLENKGFLNWESFCVATS